VSVVGGEGREKVKRGNKKADASDMDDMEKGRGGIIYHSWFCIAVLYLACKGEGGPQGPCSKGGQEGWIDQGVKN
jgi:hypothetical protein